MHALRKTHPERYRSGHNEAVLKTVCPQGRVGSNPTLSAPCKNQKKLKKDLTNRLMHGSIYKLYARDHISYRWN